MTRQQYRVRLILSVPEGDIIEDEMDMDVQLRALLRGVVALRDEHVIGKSCTCGCDYQFITICEKCGCTEGHDPPGGWQIEKLEVDPWD